MQIQIFSVPVLGGEQINEDLNRFLRSKKVLQVEKQLVSTSQGTFWTFCVQYLEQVTKGSRKKIDYKGMLDELSFQRFSEMRQIRKQIAQEAGIPAYAVFTDEELANLAQIEGLNAAKMKGVKGIGMKKVEKYGRHFLKKEKDEKSQ